MREFEIELEGAQAGYVRFSVKGHPELGDFPVVLSGQLCNALDILAGATVTVIPDRDKPKNIYWATGDDV